MKNVLDGTQLFIKTWSNKNFTFISVTATNQPENYIDDIIL